MNNSTSDNFNLQPHRSTANSLSDSNDQWQEFDIDFKRPSGSRFGFSIVGGNKYSPAISVGHIEKGGAADCDGRLKLHDIILRVNNIDYQDISHDQAVRELKSAGKHIKMRIRRLAPYTTEKIPLSTQNNSSKLSTISNMPDKNRNNDIVTSNAVTDQPQQLPHRLPCTEISYSNQLRNSETETNTNKKPLKEYEVGTYENLKRRLLRRNDLIIHYLIQPDIASTLVPEYKESEAICIALDKSKYDSILVMSQDQIYTLLSNFRPQKALAYGIGCNTKQKTIPSPVLLQAIRLHCQKFPYIYEKATLDTLRQDINTINCNGNELFLQNPFIDPSFLGTVQDVMKYGNCVKDLSVKIRRFLEETETSEIRSWEQTDLSGKYLLHRDTNPLNGQSISLYVRIQLDHSEKDVQESDDCITTTTTYHNKVTLSYE